MQKYSITDQNVERDRICSQLKAQGHFPLHIKFDAGSGEWGVFGDSDRGDSLSIK